MDLSELKSSLLLKDVGLPAVDEDNGLSDSKNVAVEIIQKHRQSVSEDSQLLVIVLEAVLETLHEAKIKPSPTALFASLISFLEQHEGSSNPAMPAACLNALSMILMRLPTPVLRSKCIEYTKSTVEMVQRDSNDSILVKASIPCLGQFIAASGPSDWAAVAPAFMFIISKLIDEDPKIRIKAQDALMDILSAFSKDGWNASMQQACVSLVDISGKILASPERTAHEAALASNKERRKAEDNIRTAVSNALRLMGSLKQIIHILPEQSSQQICSQILSLYHLRQSLLASEATELFLAVCNNGSEGKSVKYLEEILKGLLSIKVLWGTNDAILEMSVIKLLESLALGIQSERKAYYVAKVLHLLVPQLASHAEGVARSTSDAMASIIRHTITDDLIIAAMSGERNNAIFSIISAVESSFGAQYFASWELCLMVAQELISKLGKNGSTLAAGLIQKIGHICAGADDVLAASDDLEISRITEIAQNTLGVCLRCLSPETVLKYLPLDIEEALDGQAEGRTWLIPLMKVHMKGGNVSFWLTDIYPLAKSLESRRSASDPSSRQNSTLYALELQLWSTLPSFVSWAKDIPDSFSELSEVIGPSFLERHDLRLYISQVIETICFQTRAILIHQNLQNISPDPCSGQNIDDEIGEDTEDDCFEDQHYLLQSPSSDGQKRLEVLKEESKNWITILLNAFIEAHASNRNNIQRAISSYMCLCGGTLANTVFKSAMSRVIKIANQLKSGELGKDAVFDGGDTDIERYCTHLEAIYALLGGLDSKGLTVVFQLVSNNINEKEPGLQKKSYKILYYLIDSRPEFFMSDCENVIEKIVAGGLTAMSASRGFRIKCLKSIILQLLNDEDFLGHLDVEQIPSLRMGNTDDVDIIGTEKIKRIMAPMVSEIVLSIKESNKKTRAAAYDLLIDVAKGMEQHNPTNGINSLIHLILGGLVGSTAQMVSATVLALARILFEFTPKMVPLMDELLPAVLMLLRSKSREVLKAVLGFLKIAVMKLDCNLLHQYTPQILEGILISAEDSKNKFRLRVRAILERLAKKVGFKVLEENMPESHKSLLIHIRKQMNRKERARHAKSEIDWDGQSFATTVFDKTGRSVATSMRSKSWKNDMLSDDAQEKFDRKAKTDDSLKSHRRTKVGSQFSPTGDQFNLLDSSTTRQMVGLNVRRSGHIEREREDEEKITFIQDDQGRLIISEEKKETKKRERDDFLDQFDSDDSDIEDIRSIHGANLALKGTKSIARASSYAGTIKSRAPNVGKRKTNERRPNHSGDRFKAKSRGTGGDVKGKSAVEPYAYWPLDRKMLNRRQQKTRSAKQGLDKVVNAAKEGALKGKKAKRRRSS